MSRLAQASDRIPLDGGETEAVRELKSQFVSEVAGEDPRNGEITVKLVDLPFVFESDSHENALWAL